MSDATPASLGYRWPAEWEPHAGTWLAWPHKLETWPGKFEPIPAVWQKLVRTLAEFEPVHVLAGGEAVMRQARALVGDVANVTLHDIPTNDVWARDHGAMFLSGPPSLAPALVDWEYNAWGGKYPPFDLDNQVPDHMARLTGRRRYSPGIVMEGGALDGDGDGTILTTEPCLLNPNRNPQLNQQQIEQYLRDYLARKRSSGWRAAWRATTPTDTSTSWPDLSRRRRSWRRWKTDPADENYEPLRDNFARLREMTDARGRPLEVITLPMPAPKYYDEQRLPACYLNFYIANGVVVVPTFDDPADKVAIEMLARLFPGRQIRGIHATDLVWGLGAFHCITQQQPK